MAAQYTQFFFPVNESQLSKGARPCTALLYGTLTAREELSILDQLAPCTVHSDSIFGPSYL